MKDYSRLQAISHIVKVVVSQKWWMTDTLLLHIHFVRTYIHDKLWVIMMDTWLTCWPNYTGKVKVAGTLSEWFRVNKGVWQGRVLSPYLFNILSPMVMRETLGGFQGGLQIGGQMITNFCYADDIIQLATLEGELQELVDRLDRVSRRYSLLINVDKTKVMMSDGIACRILIQNEQLE